MNPNVLPLEELRSRLRWAHEHRMPSIRALSEFVGVDWRDLLRFVKGERRGMREPNRRILTDFFRKFDLGVYVVRFTPKCVIARDDAPRPFLRGCVELSRRGPALRFKPLASLMGFETWQPHPENARLRSSRLNESSRNIVV